MGGWFVLAEFGGEEQGRVVWLLLGGRVLGFVGLSGHWESGTQELVDAEVKHALGFGGVAGH